MILELISYFSNVLYNYIFIRIGEHYNNKYNNKLRIRKIPSDKKVVNYKENKRTIEIERHCITVDCRKDRMRKSQSKRERQQEKEPE